VGQVVRDGDVKPIKELIATFGLNCIQFLPYLQIKINNTIYFSKGIDVGSKSVMDNKQRDRAANEKGTVSALYKLVGLSSPNDILTQLHWEQDLCASLTAVQWDAIWKNTTSIPQM
jgi:hypothetical protein